MTIPWLLYGANGYTGELIAREAVLRGMRPILAGRSPQPIVELARELGCPHAVFSLDDHTSMVAALSGVRAVLNCAGPFSQTARSLMQGCLATHVHYFDVTGEIDVFELAHSVHEKAQRAGVVLCPGVGFDVASTDCLAVALRQALPDATHLALGFDSGGNLSRGTAKTAIESLAGGCRVRRDGEIVSVALGSITRRIDFGGGEKLAAAVPWGDVSTAYYSTGIPNIEVYSALSMHAVRRLQRTERLRPLLRRRWIVKLLARGVERRVKPPDQTQRASNPAFVWGEVRNAAGQVRTGRLRTANAYVFTVSSALAFLQNLPDESPYAGFATPAMLMGADFAASLPGSTPIHIE
ncbi:MAG: saccharopine dehydrogenase NADP-binding domain-containing protein [Steroidobacteraceae bacterium]|jgi:short subunit dehydrogenase-like uncharacterized protein|nr:saccharopine dehydrogenase NADP-binding domain-containing protein [Steroidobacteraceae bacterium]